MQADMPFQPLDHAAAHERLADLALEGDALDRLAASAMPEDRALLGHLEGCDACQAEVAASAALRDALRTAFQAMPDLPSLDPIQPPPALRAGVLAAARQEPRTGTFSGPARATAGASAADASTGGSGELDRRRPVVLGSRGRWLAGVASRWPAAIAAALVLAVVGGAVGLQLGRRSGEEDAASMVGVVATLDRVLTAEPHWVAPLQAGTATVGSVSWSKSDFAVLTTALRPPADGRVYRCWLEHDGRWAVIGQMDFGGTTAYWTGSVGDWATLDVSDGTRFVVTLESSASPAPNGVPTSPIVLQADLSE
jgi:Anti-sigma-K factor rskA